jgi:hypothetical protein
MWKKTIFLAILGLLTLGQMAREVAPGYGEEAPGYGEEAPGYGEEGGGSDEEGLALALPSTEAPISVSTNQPQSLDELIMWYDSSSCEECHGDIYEAWEKSHHARSLMGIDDLVFLGPVLRRGILSVKNPRNATRRNFPCLKCHLPQALNAADPVFAQITRAVFANDKETLRKLNISCLVCHNEMAITHKLRYGSPETAVVYGTQDVEEHENEDYPTIKKSVIMKRAVMCGQCHGLGPNLEFENPVQCATLYGSYLHAYIPSGGARTCQECHMENGNHSLFPDFNRKKETAAWLAKFISLEVETLGYQFLSPEKKYIPTVAVNTKVASKAGHRVPDG